MRRIAFIALSLVAPALAVPSTARADYFTSLAGYYQFNGSGADSSGGGRDLSLVGGPGFAAGLFGQALDLHHNGTQFAQRPGNDPAFNFGASDFTIQLWVNFNSITANEQTLFEKFSGSSGPGWTISKITRGGQNELEFYGTSFVLDSSPLSISTGVWHQILVVRSGSSVSLMYDGQVIASLSSGSAIPDSTNPLLIGRRDAQDGRDFSVDGRLDEFAIWNRALSGSELSGLYNGGRGLDFRAVPEPSSLAMLGIGTAGLLGYRWIRGARPARA